MNTWPTKKLGEICKTFLDGDWIETKDQSISGIRLVQTGNVGEGFFVGKEGGKSRFISDSTFERLRCTEIFPGDLLISRLPDPVGRSCMVPDLGIRMITAVDCTIVRANKEQVLQKFLLYMTNTRGYFKQIEENLSGTTRQRISRGNLSKIEIPLPPLPIQKQIVDRLDKIAEAQKLNDELIQKTDELFQSLLHQELNPAGKEWAIKKLGEVVDFLDNLRKPVTASDRVSGPYPYYGANGQQDSVNDYIFDDELVLLAEDGGYFGSKDRPVAYRVSGKCWVNNHAHVLKNKSGISDIDFLGYSLMYYDVTPYITGSTRSKLNKSAAEKIKISIPPLKTQEQVVAKLSAVQNYKKQLLEQKVKLKELFDSALAKSMKN